VDSGGRISGKRWNSLVDAMVERYRDLVDVLVDALMADNYPPFSAPVPEREQYARLIAMRDSMHPDFWNNPQAFKDLARLSRRYGNPQAPVVNALGERSNVESPVSLLQGYQ
jgi:hypothetical protein